MSALKGVMAEMSMPRKKRIAFWMPLAVPFCRYISTSTDARRRLPIASSSNGNGLPRSRRMRVDEGLGRALEVEDIGPAIDVGEQEVRHLLQARDEAEQVAGGRRRAVVLRQHAPQVEARRSGRAGRKPVKVARS